MTSELLTAMRIKYDPNNRQEYYKSRGLNDEQIKLMLDLDRTIYRLPDAEFMEAVRARENMVES